MPKVFQVRGAEDGWLQVEETEDMKTIRLCIDYGDSRSCIDLGKDALRALKYELDMYGGE